MTIDAAKVICACFNDEEPHRASIKAGEGSVAVIVLDACSPNLGVLISGSAGRLSNETTIKHINAMKRITFLNVGLDCETDTMTVDSSVTSLDSEDAMAVREGYTDAFVDACRGRSPEQVRAIQTILLCFAAGIAAASGYPEENISYFAGLVREQSGHFTSK